MVDDNGSLKNTYLKSFKLAVGDIYHSALISECFSLFWVPFLQHLNLNPGGWKSRTEANATIFALLLLELGC